jgi:hypothetical protein
MSDFEVNNIGTVVECRGIAKVALHALESGRNQIHDVMIQRHQDFAINELRRFLEKSGESYEDMGG